MPAFQPPFPSGKRKFEQEPENTGRDKKRLSLDHGCRSEINEPSHYEPETHQFQEHVWMVQWRNYQSKKHKTWEGDGVLSVNENGEAVLYDTDGTRISTGKTTLPLCEGKKFSFGPKEIELDRAIPRESGACFGQSLNVPPAPLASSSSSNAVRKFTTPSFVSGPKHPRSAYNATVSSPIPELNVGANHEDTMSAANGPEVTNQSLYWTANWRKPQERKNKTWDGDAFISLVQDKLYMISEKGQVMGTIAWKGQILYNGFRVTIAGKEVELDLPISASQLPPVRGLELPVHQVETPPENTVMPFPTGNQRFVSPATFYASPKPKTKKALHDPNSPDSLVMKRPTKEHIKRYNKKNLPIVDVVLDPILARKMRPHQKEGTLFLYECVMGLRKHEGQGCILADEMGLGKTLQTIALVWTLLRQNPYAGPYAVVQKVLIVCPVSLINNWKAEFHKWLGRDRVGVLTCDKANSNIDLFGRSKVYEVLVIGYERLRTVMDRLADIHPPIGLIICDEGHRLKSSNNKTASLFNVLHTRRRVILSGTPIQNDLGEFHAMAEFCNPGLLDDYSVFRKVYETPILKSRSPDASAKEIDIGDARTTQLLMVAKSFVLRRDATLLKNHLPPKSEYVVFIAPTPLQLDMFSRILNPKKLDILVQSSTVESLALINVLIKISNSPLLLKATADSVKSKKEDSTLSVHKAAVAEALGLLPEKAQIADLSLSGKLIFLSTILKKLRQTTSEKCVLVSHYTSTLNILEAYCKKMSYSYYRLDGQTPQNKRQEYVNAFNSESQHSSFVFLLSSKAGGVGINLIGASRLFIIDSDWNPSHDLQSMARCHRDGQKRPVYIYRMLTAGSIDEKIYQRQVTKLALSDSLIGSGASSSMSDSFTRKDLRDIFRIHPDTVCNTHDLLECQCDIEGSPNNKLFIGAQQVPEAEDEEEEAASKMGFISASNVKQEDLDGTNKAYLQKKKASLAALGEWSHINCLKYPGEVHILDDILRKMVEHSTSKADIPLQPEGERSRLGSLLVAMDIDRIQAMDGLKSIRDVPGGTISYLFERLSQTKLDDFVKE